MKKVLYVCLICLFVVLAAVAILFYTHQRVPLGFLATPVSGIVSFLTDSEVKLGASSYFALGKWVEVSLDSGSIKTAGQNGPTLSAEIKNFKTTFHLSSILKKRIVLDGINLQGVNLDLKLAEQGVKEASQENKEDSSDVHRVPFVLESTGEITLKEIKAAVLYDESTNPVQYQLDEGSGLFAREADGHLEISGLVNAIGLKTKITTGPFGDLLEERGAWPFSIKLIHKSIVGTAEGDIRSKEKKPEIEASVALTGNNLDDLVSLFGRTGSTNKAFSVNGQVKLAEQEAIAELAITAPGVKHLQLTGLVKKDGIKDAQYGLKVQSESINFDLLKGFITPPQQEATSQSNNQTAAKIGRDDVILPEQFPLSNLDLDLNLEHVTIAGNSFNNFTLKAVVDHGYIDQAPFSATFKTSSLSGHFSFQKEGDLPLISSRLVSRSVDIGALLEQFKLAENIDLQMGEVSTDLTTKGRTLGELVDNLDFTTISKDGVYVLKDMNTGAQLPIKLHHSTISTASGDGLQVDLKGEVRNSPVDISIDFANQRDTSKSSDDVSFSSLITLAGGTIEFDGKVPLPIKLDGAMFRSRLSSKQLSDFNDLLDLDLPAIGPLTLAGTLEVAANGYRLQTLQLDVGTSSLKGEIEFDTTPEVPELIVDLQANTIQLDDFRFERKQPENVSETVDQQGDAQKADDNQEPKRNLTDETVLEKYNSKINIEVSEVFSGKDLLGSGSLSLIQQDGTLEVMPLHLNLPGGTATLSFSFNPDDEARRYVIVMEISELDYGTIGRWYKPDTILKGTFNLRSSLTSTSSSFNDIMAGATGYIDFSIQPEELSSGVIDLWAVNLFLSLIPFLTSDNESVINCAAARFNVQDGFLHHDDLLIDTSRIQVKGKVEVDFNEKSIDAIFVPKPKRPQFLSLATPVKVTGQLSHFKAGVPPGAVLGTVIRNITSYVTVPLQWVFKQKVPKDGTANCVQLFNDRAVVP